jgi:hypothetical protein
MPTYKGPFSSNDKECNTGVGLDPDSYYPGRTPNKYTAKQTPINVAVDTNFYDSIGTQGDMLKGGFSGPVSRSKNHP